MQCIKIIGTSEDGTLKIRCAEDSLRNNNYCGKHVNTILCKFLDTNDLGDIFYCNVFIPDNLKYCSYHAKMIGNEK